MGCSLEAYRASVGSWAARITCVAAPGTTLPVESCQLAAVLSAAVIAILLFIGGVELNPGPDTASQPQAVTCAGCVRNLRSGIQCEKCYRWYHYSCGSVKGRLRESGSWTCYACRVSREERDAMRIRALEKELETTRAVLEECIRKNQELEDKLKASSSAVCNCSDAVVYNSENAGEGIDPKVLVLGDSIVRHTGQGSNVLNVRCFPGIRTEQLRRVIDNQNLGVPDAVVIHVGTNDCKRNVDHVMGDFYDLVKSAKKKFPSSKIILSGLVRRKDIPWRRIGRLNDGLDWVARTLGVQVVDPNAWIGDGDLGRDGLHLNRQGAAKLGRLFSRIGAASTGEH